MLIPGPIGARCVTVDHLQLDLGSVNTPIAMGGGNSRELAGRASEASEKKKASSFKLQASSLTAGPGSCRMNLERNKYEIKSKF